ncbi:endonuclease domain-containing protein [Microbacterium sp.]|uniref:endonuclease domain-containing protein n=1 Tax=Microbacterium sp. TaxID=51671 RepID=UPI0037C58E50
MSQPRRHAVSNGTVDVVSFVRARGGVVRSAVLRDAGATNRELTTAVVEGFLSRPRRGWLVVPGTDPDMVAAARHGVVLTCITQARRLGLWVLEHDRPHVGAPPHAGNVAVPAARVHWHKPVVPRHPDALVDPIENVLVLVAVCQPFEAAIAVWESALRQRLVDIEVLRRMRLPAAAREMLDRASPWSDSGLETFVVPRLRWLRLPLRRQIWIAGHRVDLLIGDRLVLQIDGGHHVGAQREEDIAHDAALRLLGYHVIRVGYAQVIDRWHEVQDLIMRAVAQRLHLA